jgi:hypothetical protein
MLTRNPFPYPTGAEFDPSSMPRPIFLVTGLTETLRWPGSQTQLR